MKAMVKCFFTIDLFWAFDFVSKENGGDGEKLSLNYFP